MNDDLMELPPGFRFHPTDEELITHYLSMKVIDTGFTSVAIGEVDMNKVEPSDLPWRAKMGEKEWYFFCVRDRKYPTGLRTNRATASGYWKATGKDKEIFRGKNLVGMKKTLVFYQGRAPRGEKSNWVCHEYRLEGKFSLQNLPKTTKSDWVISRVFQKTSGGKKVHISGLVRMNPPANPGELPQLTDHGPFTEAKPEVDSGSGHVHCFSNAMFPAQKAQTQGDFIANFGNPNFTSSSTLPQLESFPAESAFPWPQFPPVQTGFQYPGTGPIQDPSILRSFLYGSNMDLGFGKEMEMASASQETGMSTENSSAVSNFDVGKKALEEPQDLGCIWNIKYKN